MTEIMDNGIVVYTFGCRMNAFETQCIYKIMQDIKMKNVTLVNTCTVTAESERQVRQMIRKLHREYPDNHLILTGCASQLHSEFFIKMLEVDFVIGNEFKLQRWVYEKINLWFNDCKDGSQKSDQKKILQKQFLTQNKLHIPENNTTAYDNDWEYIYNFEDRSRAFVPIQTGCDHYCSYCIVPFTRGRFKSYNQKHIIEQVKIFVNNGYNEVVLTGIDITDYGKDIRNKHSIDTLGKLCKEILKETKLQRLRLSSVDVAEVDDDVMDLIKNEERFMPYFHISLQSGSDSVLKRMRRRHTYSDVINFCKTVRLFRPESAFGADIIAGFPSETDEEFSQSIKIVKEAPITFVHAFPYSKRERTLASLMNDDVPKDIKKSRVKELIKLGEENLQEMCKKMDGTNQKVLIERDCVARAENFVKIEIINPDKYTFGSIIEAKVYFKNNKLYLK